MRKLDKEHLKIIIWIVTVITLLIYIPYGLAYTSLWFKPFSYTYVPPQPMPVQPPASGVVYYASILEPEIPHWNLMLMAWCEGFLKLFFSVMSIYAIGLIGMIGYLFFDWLFPRVDNKKDSDK